MLGKLRRWKASRASPLKAVSCHRTPYATLVFLERVPRRRATKNPPGSTGGLKILRD